MERSSPEIFICAVLATFSAALEVQHLGLLFEKSAVVETSVKWKNCHGKCVKWKICHHGMSQVEDLLS